MQINYISESWEYWTGDPEVEEFLAEQANCRKIRALDKMPGMFHDNRGCKNWSYLTKGYDHRPKNRGSYRLARVPQLPRCKKPETVKPAKDKQGRYRQKCRLAGLCPRCGKSAAPYYECKTHRELRKILKRDWRRAHKEKDTKNVATD